MAIRLIGALLPPVAGSSPGSGCVVGGAVGVVGGGVASTWATVTHSACVEPGGQFVPGSADVTTLRSCPSPRPVMRIWYVTVAVAPTARSPLQVIVGAE